MISMTAAICDDEKAFRYEISGLVCKYMKSRNIEIYTDSYANGTELLKSEKEYDVIFLDYQMEGINGIETAEKLRETNSDSVIIFISAYPAAALDAYEVKTFRFLVKPVDESKLFKALDDYIRSIDFDNILLLNTHEGNFKLKMSEIIYLEGDGILKQKINSPKAMIVLRLIPKRVYVMLILSIICLSALTSLVSFNTADSKTKESLLIVIIIFLSVILTCIVASLILNVIAKQHFTVISQMMEKQVELQISHYEELEKMDAEMRKFRHDYTNHLQSILSLIQMKEYSDAKEYIEKMRKDTYKSAAKMFYSGNKLADAILADKSALLDEHCRIEYSGIMPTAVENVDLCVILSNSLDNAIEACREVHSPCTISVFAGLQQGYFVMSIKNPTARSDSLMIFLQQQKPKRNSTVWGCITLRAR